MEQLDVYSYLAMAAGSGMLTYVAIDLGIEALDEPEVVPETVPSEKKKPRKAKGIYRIKQIMRGLGKDIKDVSDSLLYGIEKGGVISASTGLLGFPFGLSGMAYNLYHMREEWRRLRNKDDPVDDLKGRIIAALIRNFEIIVVGAILWMAGWTWWLARHPEVIMKALDVVGIAASKGIDEVSEIIGSFTGMIPFSSSGESVPAELPVGG